MIPSGQVFGIGKFHLFASLSRSSLLYNYAATVVHLCVVVDIVAQSIAYWHSRFLKKRFIHLKDISVGQSTGCYQLFHKLIVNMTLLP